MAGLDQIGVRNAYAQRWDSLVDRKGRNWLALHRKPPFRLTEMRDNDRKRSLSAYAKHIAADRMT
jgi:hypothetical protein